MSKIKHNVTIRHSLEYQLNSLFKSSSENIKRTGGDAKTFWVGYQQAVTDIRNRFFPEYSLPPHSKIQTP